MKKLPIVFVYACLFLLLRAPTASAEEVRADRNAGQVDSVDLQNGTVVINDISYRLVSGTMVYSSGGRSVSLRQLRKGVAVRYKLHPTAGGSQPLITELQIVTAN